MRFLFKLVLAGVLVAALMPFIGPETSLGKVVQAALDDASGFCARQPGACAASANIASEAGDLIAATIADIQGDGSTALSDSDRALGPDSTIPPPAAAAAAFATHGGTIHY